MQILSAQQIREADAFTIANEPVASIDLMERASAACTQWIKGWLESIGRTPSAEKPLAILCGIGNNGGDGLAIARQLHEAGYAVHVFIAWFAETGSEDFTTNLERLQALPIPVTDLRAGEPMPENLRAAALVDALFGSGLNRPIDGWLAQLTQAIKHSFIPVVAIDMPSGLFCEDNSANTLDTVLPAQHTLCFEVPRLSFFLPEHSELTGTWHVLPIGLNQEFVARQPTNHKLTIAADATLMVRPRPRTAHKGTFGHALLIAGAHGMMGAAQMAGRACLRSGVGLLTCYVPACGYELVQGRIPEAMTLTDDVERHISAVPRELDRYSAIGIGPGIGQHKQTANALKALIQSANVPLVFDADALNLLADNKTWLSFLPKGSVLTPHPKEFERLTGKADNGWQRLQQLRDFAIRYELFVILKGANSAVAAPDGKLYFNASGNPGMATGGSGDVLTGILTGLLAQGYKTLVACRLGVFLHGLAGDLAARQRNVIAMTATDIIALLPAAWDSLMYDSDH